MKVLLVEDDEFKAADLCRIIDDVFPAATIVRAASVTSALRAITSEEFLIILLDMSLPTFDLSGPGGGGSPQGQGGIEVLRLARRLQHNSKFIVVTQYPDIEIDGRDVSLSAAPKLLSAKFNLLVTACVMYEFDGDAWRNSLRDYLIEASS